MRRVRRRYAAIIVGVVVIALRWKTIPARRKALDWYRCPQSLCGYAASAVFSLTVQPGNPAKHSWESVRSEA
jgi:hypothetical protein